LSLGHVAGIRALSFADLFSITLKQVFGDRGALMLLDSRVQRQRYGRIFLESLLPYRLTQDITDVEQFFWPRS